MKYRILLLSLVVAFAPPVFAATPVPAKPAEYKRVDANCYWQGDVLKVNPNAVIIPEGGYTQQGDSYFVAGQKKTARIVYAQVTNDWIESITPPGATSLGVPADAMQIFDPQGDVQVAFPAAPATFLPVQNGMTVANGTVIRTGANGTAAVVFGSVASARLTPNSEAAVQQTLTPGLRSTEIDLTRGAVFSKVGTPISEKEDYTVHTAFGVAAARGTDFVTIAMPARTDVWIAQGTVQLNQPGGALVGQISADGTGPLKIIRFPLISDARDAMMASAQTMTTAMNFIPLANQKVKDLRDRLAKGEKLSDGETTYLGLIKKIPYLIKLKLVPPAAPPPPPHAPVKPPLAPPAAVKPSAAVPPVASPAPATPTAPAASTPAVTTKSSSPSGPLNIHLHANGTMSFKGANISLNDLKAKLATISQETPEQPIAIQAGKKVPSTTIQQVRDICYDTGLMNVTLTSAAEPSPTAPTAPTTTSAPPATPPAPPVAPPAPPVAPPAPVAPPPPPPAPPAPTPTPAPQTPAMNIP